MGSKLRGQRRNHQGDDQPVRAADLRRPLRTDPAVLSEAVNGSNSAFSYYPRLARVLAFVDLNMGRRLSLKDVAAVACLEPKYFSAFFHRKVGLSFHQWLQERRAQRAAALIRDHDESVERIAHQVGFGCLRSLERVFRRCFGTSPREFKRTIRPC